MKILVISSNLIGDNILSTGAIQYFLEKYPDSKFTFIVGPTAFQIYENFPNLDKRIKIKKKKYNFHWLDIFVKCLFIKWDIVVDFRSSLISYFLFPKKRYIFKKKKNLHHLDQLKKMFNFDCSNLIVHNSFIENEKANKLLNNDVKKIVICPGGNWPPKIWPVELFNELMKKIISKYNNVKFIIVGSNNEKNIYFNEVIKSINEKYILDLMGETLTFTSAIMKKCDLFIGNDSGLMHLSAASKISTIGLFGPTDDKIYAPRGNKCFVIRTKESFENLRNNIRKYNESYMKTISVNDILQLVEEEKLLL